MDRRHIRTRSHAARASARRALADPQQGDHRGTCRGRDQGCRAQPLHSFRGLLTHLATLTRNEVRYGRDDIAPAVPTLATSTPTQRRAFELLDASVPLTLA